VEQARAELYGKLPRVDVGRRYADANDDVARVASEILERCLNSDLEREDDNFAEALDQGLIDHLLPGAGFLRLRYVAKTEGEGEAAKLLHEDVETEYVHWKDALWSPGARTYAEFADVIEKWYVTEIPTEIADADAFMPENFLEGFKIIDKMELDDGLSVKAYQRG
jgi:hypothetical protein